MNKPIKIFAEHVDPAALNQFYEVMKADWVVKGALMPDVHKGYCLPIGSVIAADGVICPAAVGYDIGCGMCAIPTTFDKQAVINLSSMIFTMMYDKIPVGFDSREAPLTWEGWQKYDMTPEMRKCYVTKGASQLGTLGGGNHFIEVGYDINDSVWVVVHSGSRNLGHQTATRYMKLASKSEKAKEWHYGLEVDSEEGKNYIIDLAFALEYALANREQIIIDAVNCISKHVAGKAIWDGMINRNHNHAELKDGLWIHRKGATHAETGMLGVIPGNMRDGSFIVRGRGNEESLCSSSHGAGRVLGRRAANEGLGLEEFKETMKGITAKVDCHTLDESPMAYKSIFEVMEQQSELVEVLGHVRPILNVKG